MGVLNITPDSFADGGRRFDAARAVAHGEAMVAAGVAIVDVGGESTLRDLPAPTAQPCPVLLALSRKSFIHRLGPAPSPSDRLPGSLVAAAYAAVAGVDVLRVHDVPGTVQAVRVAVAPAGRPAGAVEGDGS